MTNRKNYDIIHVRDYYPSNENPASSPWVYDQVKALQKFNINSLVISPTPYIPDFLRSKGRFYLYPKTHSDIREYKGTDVIRPQYFKIPNNKLLAFNFNNLSKIILKSISNNNGFSLIHAHFGQNGIAAIILKEKYNIPLITSFYGFDSGRLGTLYKPYYKRLAEKGDMFLVLSEDMKIDLVNLGFPKNKIKIHHLGIDPFQFKPKMKDAREKFIFLVVARLDESKGVQDVIKAFSKINNTSMQLRIIGDGIYKKQLLLLVNELNLSDQVIFINNFKSKNPRQVVVDEMQNSDVVLLTSFISKNGAKEGTPVVLMEAQACGKPCIATKHAGIPEVVIDGETGCLVEERDIASIANKMNLLFLDNKLRNSLGKNALSYIKKEFNQVIQMHKLINIYNQLM